MLFRSGMEDVRVAERALSGSTLSASRSGSQNRGDKTRAETSGKKSTTSYSAMTASTRMKLLEVLLSRLQSDKITLLREAEVLSGSMSRRVLPHLKSPTAARTVPATLHTIDLDLNTSSESRTGAATTSSSQTITPQLIQSPLRTWGEQSRGLPMTLHRPDAFLRKGKRHA